MYVCIYIRVYLAVRGGSGGAVRNGRQHAAQRRRGDGSGQHPAQRRQGGGRHSIHPYQASLIVTNTYITTTLLHNYYEIDSKTITKV
jgi:hypothetical protein